MGLSLFKGLSHNCSPQDKCQLIIKRCLCFSFSARLCNESHTLPHSHSWLETSGTEFQSSVILAWDKLSNEASITSGKPVPVLAATGA